MALAADEPHLLLADGASLQQPELQALGGLIEKARAPRLD